MNAKSIISAMMLMTLLTACNNQSQAQNEIAPPQAEPLVNTTQPASNAASEATSVVAQPTVSSSINDSLDEATLKQIEAGKPLYEKFCQSCHAADGKGRGNAFPPLAQSDYMLDDRQRGINAIVNGVTGPITVNGKTYNGFMPSSSLTDKETADVITYVFNSFGNRAGTVSEAEISSIRQKP